MKRKLGLIAATTFIFLAFSACGNNDNQTHENSSVMQSEQSEASEKESGEDFIVDGIRQESENVFCITSKEGLFNFNKAVNGYERFNFPHGYFRDSIIRLETDINYDAQWECIVDTTGTLQGATFDGNGHYISGLEYVGGAEISNNPPIGFFGAIASDFTIQNLTLKNCGMRTDKGKWAGVVVGYHTQSALAVKNVTIDSCYLSYSTMETVGSKKIGGIIGFSQDQRWGGYGLIIEGCTIKNSNLSGYISVGGIGGSIFYYMDTEYAQTISIKNNLVQNCVFNVSKSNIESVYANQEISPYDIEKSEAFFKSLGNFQEGNHYNVI